MRLERPCGHTVPSLVLVCNSDRGVLERCRKGLLLHGNAKPGKPLGRVRSLSASPWLTSWVASAAEGGDSRPSKQGGRSAEEQVDERR